MIMIYFINPHGGGKITFSAFNLSYARSSGLPATMVVAGNQLQLWCPCLGYGQQGRSVNLHVFVVCEETHRNSRFIIGVNTIIMIKKPNIKKQCCMLRIKAATI